jgi:chorismate synthase
MWNGSGVNFRVTTFGESHGAAVGAVVEGVPPGLAIDEAFVQAELDLRRPGASDLVSPRSEGDRAEILSGLFEGRATGAPVAFLIRNEDVRSADYASFRRLFRPGHGDFGWAARFGVRDWRGGGRLSGRETAARVAAGALAKLLLAERGVLVRGETVRIGAIRATRRDPLRARSSPVRCGDPAASARMAAAIRRAAAGGDSLGGIVEVTATGVPAGWGEPVFGKLDALLGAAMLSIGAVKGVEFGDGFALAAMRGSEANDPITPQGFASNRAGGVLGGISNGMPIVLRIAVKPTSTIALPQATIDARGRAATIRGTGRHDPCVVPRVVAVAEAMAALVLADAALSRAARPPAGGSRPARPRRSGRS